jgi:hypothetical protein
MKLHKLFTTLMLVLVLNAVSAQAKKEKWAQMDAYHQMMSKTFHTGDEGNLEAIKKTSQLLLERADAITEESIPANLRSAKLSEALVVLKRETKKVDDLVQAKAPDATIVKVLTNLHDVFHQIVGMCGPEEH